MNRSLGGRTTIVDGVGGVEVHIRAPRLWGPLIFLPVWFAGWTFGGITAIRHMIIEPQLFVSVWLVAWLVGELFVALAWSWMAFGEEVVTVAQRSLTIVRKIGPLQIARSHSLPECKALRAERRPGPPMSFSDSLRPWGLGGEALAIDCKSTPVRFGFALDEKEASAVVRELQPFLGDRS